MRLLAPLALAALYGVLAAGTALPAALGNEADLQTSTTIEISETHPAHLGRQDEADLNMSTTIEASEAHSGPLGPRADKEKDCRVQLMKCELADRRVARERQRQDVTLTKLRYEAKSLSAALVNGTPPCGFMSDIQGLLADLPPLRRDLVERNSEIEHDTFASSQDGSATPPTGTSAQDTGPLTSILPDRTASGVDNSPSTSSSATAAGNDQPVGGSSYHSRDTSSCAEIKRCWDAVHQEGVKSTQAEAEIEGLRQDNEELVKNMARCASHPPGGKKGKPPQGRRTRRNNNKTPVVEMEGMKEQVCRLRTKLKNIDLNLVQRVDDMRDVVKDWLMDSGNHNTRDIDLPKRSLKISDPSADSVTSSDSSGLEVRATHGDEEDRRILQAETEREECAHDVLDHMAHIKQRYENIRESYAQMNLKVGTQKREYLAPRDAAPDIDQHPHRRLPARLDLRLEKRGDELPARLSRAQEQIKIYGDFFETILSSYEQGQEELMRESKNLFEKMAWEIKHLRKATSKGLDPVNLFPTNNQGIPVVTHTTVMATTTATATYTQMATITVWSTTTATTTTALSPTTVTTTTALATTTATTTAWMFI